MTLFKHIAFNQEPHINKYHCFFKKSIDEQKKEKKREKEINAKLEEKWKKIFTLVRAQRHKEGKRN